VVVSADQSAECRVNRFIEEEEMADIDVERKSGTAWIWWILGLIVLALLAWWLFAGDDEPEVAGVVEPAPVVAPAGPTPANPPPPAPVAQGGLLTLADVWANPSANIGNRVYTPESVRVAQVISDRAFVVEDQGNRIHVVLNEGAQQNPQPGTADVQGMPAEKPDIDEGDMIQITEAVAQDPTFLQNLQGPIEPETRTALNGQKVFLVTDGRNVRKM
jgi:hypothetical protein